MQVSQHSSLNLLETPPNPIYDSLLSSKISRITLAAFSWSAGFGSFYPIAFFANPILAIGLVASGAVVGCVAGGYFLFHHPQINFVNKVTLVALSSVFYIGGFLTSTLLYSSAYTVGLMLVSAQTLDINLGLIALSTGLAAAGFVIPGLLKAHQTGHQIFTGIDSPIDHLPDYLENLSTCLPAYICNPIFANTCLFIEHKGFKSFLLRLQDYNTSLEELVKAFKTPEKLQRFWNKCQAFDIDANHIFMFCTDLNEKIEAIKSPQEAEELMQSITSNAKNAIDLSTLFSLLKQDRFNETKALLVSYYDRFLKNDDKNTYIKKLRPKLPKVQEDEDSTPAYEVLGHLMSTEQCRKYLVQLNLAMSGEGPIFTFQKELEMCGLGTLGELKSAKLYPLEGTTDIQEAQLLAGIATNRTKKSSLFSLFKSSLSSKNIPFQQTLSKIMFLAKRIFIEITLWVQRLISFASNPWLFSAGLTYGLLYSDNTSELVYSIPNAESILYTDDVPQGARHYCFALFLNGMRGMSGFLTARAILRVRRIARRIRLF